MSQEKSETEFTKDLYTLISAIYNNDTKAPRAGIDILCAIHAVTQVNRVPLNVLSYFQYALLDAMLNILKPIKDTKNLFMDRDDERRLAFRGCQNLQHIFKAAVYKRHNNRIFAGSLEDIRIVYLGDQILYKQAEKIPKVQDARELNTDSIIPDTIFSFAVKSNYRLRGKDLFNELPDLQCSAFYDDSSDDKNAGARMYCWGVHNINTTLAQVIKPRS